MGTPVDADHLHLQACMAGCLDHGNVLLAMYCPLS